MFIYDISKYTEDKWDENGYCADWISIHDIGREYYGKVLTVEEYKRVEDTYIKALYYVVDYMNIKSFRIDKIWVVDEEDLFEMHKNHIELYDEDLLSFYRNVGNIKELEYKDIGNFCRLQLREDTWAVVKRPWKMGIFICYDFILGIRTSRSIEPIIPMIEALGLDIDRGTMS